MTEKTKYWIADIDGVKAQADGADDRDIWTRVRGWSETTEPVAGDMVWLEHETTGGKQKFSAEAAPQWAGLGWLPSSPPAPADFTKDPNFVDQLPVAAPAVEAKPKTQAPAGAADKKE